MKEKGFIIIIALLIASTVYAGGLYDKTQTPIDGTVVSYRRMPYAEISNPLNVPPSIQMTTELVKLYPDGATQSSFVRRVNVGYLDFIGKSYPLYNPADGTQIGTVSGDTLYSLLYSTWILGEKKADNLIRFKDGATICYVTNSTIQVCP